MTSPAIDHPVRMRDPAPRANPLTKLAREPLLHFLLLGALVLVVQRRLAPADDNNTIHVSADTDTQIRETFREAESREPTPAELEHLRDAWVDSEVLYREGLAMRLDRGDPMIRDRVALKTQVLLASSTNAEKTDEPGLRRWFEAHRSRYDQPARFDFYEAQLVDAGTDLAAAAQRLATALDQGEMTDELRANLKIFRGRPRPTVVHSFGETFASSLEQLPINRWTALQGTDGWHVVRLERITPPVAVEYDAVRPLVENDHQQASAEAARLHALKELRKKYRVVGPRAHE